MVATVERLLGSSTLVGSSLAGTDDREQQQRQQPEHITNINKTKRTCVSVWNVRPYRTNMNGKGMADRLNPGSYVTTSHYCVLAVDERCNLLVITFTQQSWWKNVYATSYWKRIIIYFRGNILLYSWRHYNLWKNRVIHIMMHRGTETNVGQRVSTSSTKAKRSGFPFSKNRWKWI